MTDHTHPQDPQDLPITLGTCCACGTTDGVKTILMLERLAPIPGRGWGCFTCGLENDGALAVLCDACSEAYQSDHAILTQACRGYPAEDGRCDLAALGGHHEHNLARHPEAQHAGTP